MEPRFQHLFDLWIEVDRPQDVGEVPRGHRFIGPVTGGRFEGPGLRGQVLPVGADWFLLRGEVAEIDVRLALRSDDGALIYMTYGGVLRPFSTVVQHMVRGEQPPRDAYYWYITPRFETGHEAYQWLNQTVAVGVGGVGPRGSVYYRVYALV
jgi:hypothetical protein